MNWLYRKGHIIGVDMEGIVYDIIHICKNVTLHQLYHEQLKKDKEIEYKDGKNGK